MLYDGRNVGGFAEFFSEPFRAGPGEPEKPVISEFSMNARLDLIDNGGATTGNGKINDGVDAPPGGITMCQNDSRLNCHIKEEHPWKMLA